MASLTIIRASSHDSCSPSGFPASVEAVETTMRTSLFARSTLIVSAGKATTITANPNDLDKIVTFLGDLGRLRELEHAWDVCVRNRRRSNVETRAASPIAPADNPTSLDSFDDGMIGACIMLPAAFAAALHAWYFEKGCVQPCLCCSQHLLFIPVCIHLFRGSGLLAPLFPKDSVPTQPDGRIGWSSRHFFKAEQHGLASIPQKLLLEFKRSVMAGEIPRSPAAPTAGQMSPTGERCVAGHKLTYSYTNTHIPGAPKKTVIVLGGGICGITICQDIEAIDDTFHTILIDKKDYFEFTPLVIRNLSALSCITHAIRSGVSV